LLLQWRRGRLVASLAVLLAREGGLLAARPLLETLLLRPTEIFAQLGVLAAQGCELALQTRLCEAVSLLALARLLASLFEGCSKTLQFATLATVRHTLKRADTPLQGQTLVAKPPHLHLAPALKLDARGLDARTLLRAIAAQEL
jgi:hypothetical protein